MGLRHETRGYMGDGRWRFTLLIFDRLQPTAIGDDDSFFYVVIPKRDGDSGSSTGCEPSYNAVIADGD